MSVENSVGNYGQNYNYQYAAPRVQYRRNVANPNFGNGSEADTYQSSGGGLMNGLIYTGLGAGAGGAAGYYLMGNPISEGENGLKVNEKFYQSLDNAMLEEKIGKAVNAAELEKLQSVNIASKEEFEALKKLAKAEGLEKLPDEVKNALPKEITTPQAAQELVTKAEAEIAKIDKSAIAKTTKETFLKNGTYKEILETTKKFEKLDTEIAKLADDIKPNELKEFITKNKELFNIKGEEAAVTAEIERLSQLGKKELLENVKNLNDTWKNALKYLDETVLAHVNQETKSLAAEAPEFLKNAFKEFKWSQAKQFGLWGAATALGAYVISSLFGSSGNNKA